MTTEMMSSEESDPEDENSMVVRPLLWRSTLVDEFYEPLDSQMKSCRLSLSVYQSKYHIQGEPSTRPQPADIPKWAYYSSKN